MLTEVYCRPLALVRCPRTHLHAPPPACIYDVTDVCSSIRTRKRVSCYHARRRSRHSRELGESSTRPCALTPDRSRLGESLAYLHVPSSFGQSFPIPVLLQPPRPCSSRPLLAAESHQHKTLSRPPPPSPRPPRRERAQSHPLTARARPGLCHGLPFFRPFTRLLFPRPIQSDCPRRGCFVPPWPTCPISRGFPPSPIARADAQRAGAQLSEQSRCTMRIRRSSVRTRARCPICICRYLAGFDVHPRPTIDVCPQPRCRYTIARRARALLSIFLSSSLSIRKSVSPLSRERLLSPPATHPPGMLGSGVTGCGRGHGHGRGPDRRRTGRRRWRPTR